MADNTFIKLYRSLLNWEWYTDVNTTKLFLHLLLVANRFPSEWRGIRINQGQRLTSLSKLASETGLTIQQTRTAISHLKLTGEITSESTNGYTLITVENYAKFQGCDSEPTYESTSNLTSESTSDQHASQQQIKKEKKVKKDKEDIYRSEVHAVIAHLNEVAGKNFNADAETTARFVRERLKDGHTVSECIYVIDIKTQQWLDNPEMRTYLRPKTLFNKTNFEEYVHEQPTTGNAFADAVMFGELSEEELPF